mmetsp:Transcript_11846/g.10464  ORF Transcript_11846/g.10464 Transcript_11846/m.10464 type:complete len:134 (+) Transcript_11846:326-727(+)
MKNHYPSRRRENGLLPALMKIKNTKLFRDYNRILMPLHEHKKLNQKINQFLKSSYRKDIKFKRSDLSTIKKTQNRSISCTKSYLTAEKEIKQMTPIRNACLVKPLRNDFQLDTISAVQSRNFKNKIQAQLKRI